MKQKLHIPNIQNTVITPALVKNRNCENLIGSTQVPLGLAGPLLITFQDNITDTYMLPLSTTEGALVASVNRGCKAVGLSGGVRTYFEDVGATRGPLFRVKNLAEAANLVKYVSDNLNDIALVAQKNTPFIKFQKEEHQVIGKNVFFRFYFNTSEAMGMNMVTQATEKISRYLESALNIKCLALSGNFCQDKKPSFTGFLLGRGKKVWAEAIIKKSSVTDILKTTPKDIVEIVQKKSHLGSIVSGSLGYNAHFANILAAIFLATGQDIAHVVEGSMGITDAEIEDNGDLYFSVYLPDIMVGTVGGGTGLPTQKEALGILGLDRHESGDSLKLAQIIAAGVLAGELSLTAAIAAGHLAKAHEKLGRGIKTQKI
ncbi:MAG: hydroxymethylglutaryl-CoA reductase [Candidatus Shapirobacteria bacterium]|jgi:hydroxymethylglutaryl-CoA reductase (NADPH)